MSKSLKGKYSFADIEALVENDERKRFQWTTADKTAIRLSPNPKRLSDLISVKVPSDTKLIHYASEEQAMLYLQDGIPFSKIKNKYAAMPITLLSENERHHPQYTGQYAIVIDSTVLRNHQVLNL